METESIFAEGKAAFDRADYQSCLATLLPLAENGFAPAQCLLGVLYHLGLGVQEDFSLALYWYRQASEGGDGVASNNLGTMYYSGQGIPPDEKEAKRWYQKAHEQGFIHPPPWE